MAGDISPIDVLTHIPIVCEDHQIPYIYVPSKEVRLKAVACDLYVSCQPPFVMCNVSDVLVQKKEFHVYRV